MPDQVSVIIPARNYAHYLGDAIESALHQGHRPVEVIVVDDGSTDETPAVLGRFEGQVHVIRLDGRGVAEARNAGLARASGTYVVFLDADDLLLPGGLAALAECLGQHPDVDAVCGPWYVCDVRLGISFLVRKPFRSSDVIPRMLLGNLATTPSAVMVRRRVLEVEGGFNPAVSYTADWELWLRLAARGHRFSWIPQPVAIYRVHGDSMTRNLSQTARDVWYVLDAYFSDRTLPPQALAVRGQAYFAMSLYLGKLYLEHGDIEGARTLLRRAIDLDPAAADSADFYYEVARAIWKRQQLEGTQDPRSPMDAAIRFALTLATPAPPVPPARNAAVHLAVGLVARRAGDQRLALRHLGVAVRSSGRAVATRRHLVAAWRICIPLRTAASVKAGLARMGLRTSTKGPVPRLVSMVMASPRPQVMPVQRSGA